MSVFKSSPIKPFSYKGKGNTQDWSSRTHCTVMQDLLGGLQRGTLEWKYEQEGKSGKRKKRWRGQEDETVDLTRVRLGMGGAG